MDEIVRLVIGVLVLVAGFPIGNILAQLTKEELAIGGIWFKAIIILCLIGGVIGLILRNDFLMFSLFFVAIVTSRCLTASRKTRAK